MREIKVKIIYQSPNTDEPNKLYISEPLTIQELMFSDDTQVDFTDGSYLRYNELEEESTKFVQYTGLKDKNGKEIYEGDIVNIANVEGNIRPYEVQFNDGCFDVVRSYQCEYHRDYLKCHTCNHVVEVIDNIYENPNLLNEGKDERKTKISEN